VGVWRKWIFPIIRIVIFTAIAVALVKIAFFGEVGLENSPDVPTATITELQIPVAIGTIQNDVVLQGTVAADEAVEVKATAPGVVRTVNAGPGAWVDAGADLFVIREQVTRDDGTTWARDIKVKAPSSGTLASVAIIVGQSITIGESIAKVAPPSFHVSATLAPEQQYRLLNQPADAQVQVLGGPAPFTCTGLTITAALASAGDNDTGTGTTLRCAVPAEVRVFAGLGAEVTIAGGVAENVLTVPITAVEGTSETGNVHFVLPDGSTELRPVTLGLNDGITVEIKDGVAEGDLILQFVPGAEEIPGGMPEGCYPVPGGMACGAGG
jgi:macrolide-specific efflux system membrane fusion protein